MAARTRMYRSAMLVLTLCVCAPVARAAVYRFDVGGLVTSSNRPDIAVGQSYSIQYVADSTDEDPGDPLRGIYAATHAVATVGASTVVAVGDPHVSVRLHSAGNDFMNYGTNVGNRYFLITAEYRAGALPSDALLLTLPSQNLIRKYVDFNDGAGAVGGSITSFQGTLIPEPLCGTGALLSAAVLAFARDGRRQRGA